MRKLDAIRCGSIKDFRVPESIDDVENGSVECE